MSQTQVTYSNNADSNLTEMLQTEIDKLPGIEKLKYKPSVTCGKVDADADECFNKTRLVPSFTFVDPFG
jgi:capsule polysaccharide export protein KpsC/LpsZ